MQHDVAVLIGRFQPFHNAHAALLAQALDVAPRVIVLLGSAHAARNAKNPFNWEERAAMVRCTLDEETRARVSFLPMRDRWDDARWAAQALEAVQREAGVTARVALVGHIKDASSQYLKRFPSWDFIPVPAQGEIDATSLRRIWFEGEDEAVNYALLSPLLPPAVLRYLQGWAVLPHFARLREEHLTIEENKRIWGTGPFVTVDALVKASGKVLLIRRGRAPGKGLWALPGGFLDGRERVQQGAIRELREETGLALSDAALEAALAGVIVFDHPDRSLRGRTITHVHFFDLGNLAPPEVAGGDDAAEAHWVPLEALAAMEGEFFEDHFNILNHFLAITH
ncbi:MAG: cytidyltransferase [Candidatus Dactylopiibacterium carminicum]|uniref:Cytidyltransferase n=1 Tax=Candidatus Dactylopiibacterium carminicum TaxID=857335 RepID=A0A272ESL0_9RHOO|nr:bifunctional nicotinamide-nucleotide adenylyltransferase/Nudix hydroxylase [Candidatus Dactylopiibacterium carminicum]KAF7599057.1 cytidyltransferase [Candidatus Dactylopiibacterium carminicum]PAS93092.1 MAG: cytidyltransferase [Candidatus Dactylopiibacterium carminicum]PAS96657.1 MAG: cytidyltransferase [Candidatus Dactylopiibacterium carminicum]PAS99070.1 MAG: cytidyltransferase [Candidatus Dactylopiibacterium carminicum]